MVKISPSLLAGDFLHLENEIKNLEKSNVDFIHFDVMDGHYVPNLSYGFKFISSITEATKIKADVHLMITNPGQYLEEYIKTGSNLLTFHYETTNFHIRTAKEIKKHNCMAGVSINPATPVNLLLDLLPHVDVVLIMSVEPGFYGQKFIENSYKKIEKIKNIIINEKYKTQIEVDGGVGIVNYKQIIDAGADILVIGNDYFKQEDYTTYVKTIKEYGR